MNEYQRIALETRKRVSKITLEQQKQLLNLYDDVIKDLSRKASKSKSKSLTERWVLDYKKQLIQAKKELAVEINKQIASSITSSAKVGVEGQQLIIKGIFEHAGIDTGNHFTTMFSQAPKSIIEDIISGNLYKDKLTLSQRIWNHSGAFEKDIQYVINQGLLEKKSAIELAKDLEQFVREPAKRPTTWGKAYPHLKNKVVDYSSQRLARTSINHAYQGATIKSSGMNPFVEGIRWRSALIHGRTCDLCMERHDHVYLFGVEEVPLDHANGLCTMLPEISKSLDQVADELKGWLDGGTNNTLDKWYNEYGNHFAFKKL